MVSKPCYLKTTFKLLDAIKQKQKKQQNDLQPGSSEPKIQNTRWGKLIVIADMINKKMSH